MKYSVIRVETNYYHQVNQYVILIINILYI